MTTATTKSRRATAVVERDGKVLLVRENGERRFKLPGGEIGQNDLALEAALRELREQTGLLGSKAEFLFRHEGNVKSHRVVRIQAPGATGPRGREIAECKWWDGRESISLLWAAKSIIDRCVKFAPANPDGTRR